ncbi:MAG: DUF4167 domain-containing protein [Porphyrobacter sp.]|nr:DUF4167 domain-containing protein [Porphyrobacter sp.]
MNNNRSNRRRGRGNRNQAGNGNQVNRIDSRARGNAPQLLDKYKKLAQDAQHNGDRVQMEYYLQFADHYFRVIADNKARQEEARGRRFEEREPQVDESDDDFDFDRPRRPERSQRPQRDDEQVVVGDEGEFAVEAEFAAEGESFLGDPAEDAAAAADAAAERASARRNRQRKPRGEDGGDKRAERPERAERAERNERPERGDKPRRKPRRAAGSDDAPGGIDSAVLPPAIRAGEADESDGNLEAVG